MPIELVLIRLELLFLEDLDLMELSRLDVRFAPDLMNSTALGDGGAWILLV